MDDSNYILIYTAADISDYWLRDVLTAEGIPHRTEIRPFYADPASRAGYGEKYLTYIPPQYSERVQEIIRTRESDVSAGAGYDPQVDRIPTRPCPDCGRRYEVDFVKCPYCNADLFDRIKRFVITRFDPDN